jgi:hypothetical protein
MIFETLKKLSDNQRKHPDQEDPSYIFLDENNQVKKIPLSKLDSSASAYINNTVKFRNPTKLIHDSIFGKY